MPRLLVVNPNTSQSVTDLVAIEARRCARPDTEIAAVTGTFGVRIVSIAAEEVIAAHAALELLAARAGDFDAAVIAMSFDTGVIAARSLFPVPVIGITEAAIHAACLLGHRFGLIVLGAMSLPLYQALLDRIGLRARLGAVEVVAIETASAYLDRAAIDEAVLAAATRLAAAGSVDVAVACGAALAGVAHRLADRAPLPLLDSIGPAIGQAELLAMLRPASPRRPSRLSAGEKTTGLGPALAALLEHPTPPKESDR